MCLVTSEYPFIAERDIVCYKVLVPVENGGVSPFYNYYYRLNEIYNSMENCSCELEYYNNSIIFSISKNMFHAYLKERYAKNATCSNFKIFKCIIPEGSICFNNDVEICSNKIIVESVLSI